MQSKAKGTIMVGYREQYSTPTRAYKLIDLETQQYVFARSVVFQEDKFLTKEQSLKTFGEYEFEFGNDPDYEDD